MDYGTLTFVVSASVVTIAAVIDAQTRRIPNWLVGPYLLTGLLVRYWIGGDSAMWDGAAAMSLGFLVTLPLYLLGGLGMGDCKLLGAVGAWVGLYQMVFVLFGTAIAGGILAVLYVSRRGLLAQSLDSTAAVVTGWARRGIRKDPAVSLEHPNAISIPYGPAIAAGAFFSFLYV